jgi:hypothetical protein
LIRFLQKNSVGVVFKESHRRDRRDWTQGLKRRLCVEIPLHVIGEVVQGSRVFPKTMVDG